LLKTKAVFLLPFLAAQLPWYEHVGQTHGFAETREDAMSAFAKSWRRGKTDASRG
jgi:hypothetical protein